MSLPNAGTTSSPLPSTLPTLRSWKSSGQDHRGDRWAPGSSAYFPVPHPPPVVSALEYAPPTLYPARLSPLASDDTTVCFSSSSLCSFLDGLCGLCSSHRCLLTWESRLGAVVSWEQSGVTQRGHLQSPEASLWLTVWCFLTLLLAPNI